MQSSFLSNSNFCSIGPRLEMTARQKFYCTDPISPSSLPSSNFFSALSGSAKTRSIFFLKLYLGLRWNGGLVPGNTKGGSIPVPLTSCLTGLESDVRQLKIFVFICNADKSKPVKQEVNGTVIFPP